MLCKTSEFRFQRHAVGDLYDSTRCKPLKRHTAASFERSKAGIEGFLTGSTCIQRQVTNICNLCDLIWFKNVQDDFCVSRETNEGLLENKQNKWGLSGFEQASAGDRSNELVIFICVAPSS